MIRITWKLSSFTVDWGRTRDRAAPEVPILNAGQRLRRGLRCVPDPQRDLADGFTGPLLGEAARVSIL